MSDELLHLQAQEFDVFKRGVERDIDVDDFLHSLTPRDVLDPEVVKDNVGDLHDLHLINAVEDSVEQRDPLYSQLLLLGTHDVDTVANIEGMLDKQEDAGTEKLLCGDRKDERK